MFAALLLIYSSILIALLWDKDMTPNFDAPRLVVSVNGTSAQ